MFESVLVADGRLPDGWDTDVPKFSPDDGAVATRKASQQVIQWVASKVPQLVSGSADLEPGVVNRRQRPADQHRVGHLGR